MARAIFFGQKGELRKKYREGQEDQLGALGLVVNMIVLWNTQYMSLALDSLRKAGGTITEEDIARLSPLIQDHINRLGTYRFALPGRAAARRALPAPQRCEARRLKPVLVLLAFSGTIRPRRRSRDATGPYHRFSSE